MKARINVLSVVILCGVLSLVSCDGEFPQPKITSKPLWNTTITDKLKHDLLLNYDRFARPTEHYNKTTVRFGIAVKHIEVNEFKSTLTVYSWARMVWKDEKLKWNETEYGDINVMRVANHEIWKPDIFVYNSATSTPVLGDSNCLVYGNGEVLWVPPISYTVLCEFDLRFWPFDKQVCALQFGSWTYHGDQIDLQIYNGTTELDEVLVTNTEWELISMESTRNVKYYNCCAEAYPDITITLTMQRRSPSYKSLIITPAFAIIMLTLMNFWLPPQAGEKIILNGCTAIIVTMFMLYFTQKVPAMGTHTPLIVFFFSSSLYIVCFSMANSIFVLWLSRTKHNKPLPWIIKQPLVGGLEKWLGLSHLNAQSTHRSTAEEMRDHPVTDFEENNTNDEHQIIGSMSSSSVQQDWIILAAAIDRLSFIFYAVLFGVLAIAYSL